MARASGDLGVLHLAREANGLEPFRSFLDSYRDHAAGVDHEVVLLLKGFGSEEATEPYRTLAADVSSRSISIRDDGYDLGSYLDAAERLDFERLCFLNSFSTVNSDGWLAMLASPLDDPGIRVAGATGSWGSQASMIRYHLRLGGPYADVYRDRAATRRVFKGLGAAGPEPPAGLASRAVGAGRTLVAFPDFPAPHLRTNAFLIRRDLLLGLGLPRPRSKLDAYVIESGRRSLTRQVEQTGAAVVVGRNGDVYQPTDWARSRTFWQGDQENLLVSDRQTRSYERGSDELRLVLSRFAWGAQADPVPTRTSRIVQ
jgi:hypothetical protein